MTTQIDIEGIKCIINRHPSSKKVAYMIYPALVPLEDSWINQMTQKYCISIIMVYIPADGWNDMLTPWPEEGETPKSPPFTGQASITLKLIQEKIIPETDKILNITTIEERSLIGVSLGGLFTLWEWIVCDTFKSIGCLSGSFWYPGFLQWFEGQKIPSKSGKAYFLLGVKEPKAWIKAYRTVGINTEKIVDKLKECGILTSFEWVPGNHIANPYPRAEDALKALFS